MPASSPPTRAAFEKVAVGIETSFSFRRVRGRRFTAPYHYHPEVELTWIVRSSGHRIVGDSIAPFTDGDLALIGPNLPHVWLNHPSCQGAEALVVQFLPGFLGSSFFELPEMSGVKRLLLAAQRGLTFSSADLGRIAPILESLNDAGGPPRIAALLTILHELTQSISSESLCSSSYIPSLSPGAEAKINKVYRRLTTGFTETIFQAEIAESLGMSPAMFSRFFRNATGRGFTETLIDLRLSHACMLLRETDRSVAEVCFLCGFENLSNFNRQFRRRCRMSPREWRSLAVKALGVRKL